MQISREAIQAAEAVLRRRGHELVGKTNVTGCTLGEKRVGGRSTSVAMPS